MKHKHNNKKSEHLTPEQNKICVSDGMKTIEASSNYENIQELFCITCDLKDFFFPNNTNLKRSYIG